MNKFKVGDIVLFNNTKWIVYDLMEPHKVLCITDFETQKQNEAIKENSCELIDSKPSNVEWLFMKRRNNNLKEIQRYL